MPTQLSRALVLSCVAVFTLAARATPLIPIDFFEEDPGEQITAPVIKLRAQGIFPDFPERLSLQKAVVNADPAKIRPGKYLNNGRPRKYPSSPDVQVNDPALDHIQSFPDDLDNALPFESSTESETTLAASGNNIVVSYNTSAGANLVEFESHLFLSQLLLSGYSVSHDAGKTWRSGFIPPPEGGILTFGDGIVATDRSGTFYYAGLGTDADFNNGILISSSSDGGETFSPSQVIALDPGADKEWMAIGPDPKHPSRDNIYVTWTSYTDDSSRLAFSRSTDRGRTWSPAKLIYAPEDEELISSYIQFSNPVVDNSSGRLYIPFLHFSKVDTDYMRLLVSDDGGETFRFVAFNIPGAPDIYSYPFVQPGVIADCGLGGGIRLVAKQGPAIGGGIFAQFGLPRFLQTTRLITQPAAAAVKGRLVIALNTSTSPHFGDPAGSSQIVALYSKDGGNHWAPPTTVAQATPADPQHFHPAVALSPGGDSFYVGYYVQQSNERLRTDLATVRILGNGLQVLGTRPLSSVAFDLAPNNVPSPFPPYFSLDTVNYDQIIVAGYSVGEYMGVAIDAVGNPIASWGDLRNTWTSPTEGIFPGIHTQADVYFLRP